MNASETAAVQRKACLVDRRPLRYSAGADPAIDRPAHVRAASSIVADGTHLAIIQDDSHFVAVLDPTNGDVQSITLPAGPGGLRQFDDERGNKAQKLDLEAAIIVHEPSGPVLIAFGSGSLPARERILRLSLAGSGPAQVLTMSAWYAQLRATTAFSGSELNLEGAAVLGETLYVLNRGNGAPQGDRKPVDAVATLRLADVLAHLNGDAPTPELLSVTPYELGTLGGARLTFTDATVIDGQLFFSATAEASPDAVRDGPVSGSAIGTFTADGRAVWAPVVDADGALLPIKIEGLTAHGQPDLLYCVLDDDASAAPAELAIVRLEGPWISVPPR